MTDRKLTPAFEPEDEVLLDDVFLLVVEPEVLLCLAPDEVTLPDLSLIDVDPEAVLFRSCIDVTVF